MKSVYQIQNGTELEYLLNGNTNEQNPDGLVELARMPEKIGTEYVLPVIGCRYDNFMIGIPEWQIANLDFESPKNRNRGVWPTIFHWIPASRLRNVFEIGTDIYLFFGNWEKFHVVYNPEGRLDKYTLPSNKFGISGIFHITDPELSTHVLVYHVDRNDSVNGPRIQGQTELWITSFTRSPVELAPDIEIINIMDENLTIRTGAFGENSVYLPRNELVRLFTSEHEISLTKNDGVVTNYYSLTPSRDRLVDEVMGDCSYAVSKSDPEKMTDTDLGIVPLSVDEEKDRLYAYLHRMNAIIGSDSLLPNSLKGQHIRFPFPTLANPIYKAEDPILDPLISVLTMNQVSMHAFYECDIPDDMEQFDDLMQKYRGAREDVCDMLEFLMVSWMTKYRESWYQNWKFPIEIKGEFRVGFDDEEEEREPEDDPADENDVQSADTNSETEDDEYYDFLDHPEGDSE